MARRDTRRAILEAAESVARRVGLARTTTKEVAAAAGCSEAALYYHFEDRSQLLAEAVAGRIDDVNRRVADLSFGDGHGVSQRLNVLVATVLEGFAELIGLSSPLLADPDVLDRFRAVLVERSISPEGIQSTIALKLREEQQAGRLRSDVDPHTVALLVAGACHESALHTHLMAAQAQPHLAETAGRISTTLAALLMAPAAASTT